MLNINTLAYEKGSLTILDQTLLPGEETYKELRTKEEVFEAIRSLRVRGAPAIGVAAAYGIIVAMTGAKQDNFGDFYGEFQKAKEYLSRSRPTAVNLFWALDRMERKLISLGESLPGRVLQPFSSDHMLEELLREARLIHEEDQAACLAMGEHGLDLLEPGMGLLTHCNAGALATTGYGTALAPIHLGRERGYGFKVFADETRPLLQGARLTAWELTKSGVDVTLICDDMASVVMKEGKVDAVLVGCDRMAANGDGANKIGTASLAILAKAFDIPFYMFVPTSTIDMDIPSGDEIVIENRDPEEVFRMWYEKDMAPQGIKVFNPAFDVTDNKYITAIVTERGIVRPPYGENLRKIAETSV